jgi:L-aspartate oxidase
LKNDVLIVGSGLAALSVANSLPSKMRVAVLSPDRGESCNSVLAQGGVACAVDEADIEAHIEDTVKAGAGQCDCAAVEKLIRNGFLLIGEMIKNGVPFDKDENGRMLYTKEAAHGKARILHIQGDQTGLKLHQFMQNRASCDFVKATVIDLLIGEGKAYGVRALTENGIENIFADHIVIASGGIGALYQITTSRPNILGHLQGIAARRDCRLADMHFTQFHPTVLTASKGAQKPLLTEALRGEGALIKDETGRRFLADFGIDELCPRDRVSRAVFRHQQQGHKVYLDLGAFDRGYFIRRFPTIEKQLAGFGLKAPYSAVPISPAFHYTMGGIAVDTNTKVPNVIGLYAIGEAARTGVHGANRLASNSLLEALVFGRIAAETISNSVLRKGTGHFNVFKAKIFDKDDKRVYGVIAKTLWRYTGITRTENGLKVAKTVLEELKTKRLGVLAEASLITALAVVDQAIAMPYSAGAHYLEKDSD